MFQQKSTQKKAEYGVEQVKRLCKTGELEHYMTDGGYYKIKVDSDSVPIEKYLEVKNENAELKTIIKTMINTGKQVV